MSILDRCDESPNIDYQSVKESSAGSFAKAAARVQWMGYGFALVLLLLLAFNNWYLTVDQKILAVENGQIVGTINFKNEQVRSYAEIYSDLKNWLSKYHSVNAGTIGEDRTVALHSMCPQQVDQHIELWSSKSDQELAPGETPVSVISQIASLGLTSRMTFEFEHFKKNPLPAVEILDLRGTAFKALIRGDLIVTLPDGKITEERVAHQVSGQLVNRTRDNSLGLKICEIRDVEEGI